KAVRPKHIQEGAVPVLAHRLVMNPHSKLSGKTAATVVMDILKRLPVPV
ncbi:MAG: magnesium chelatase, partial [Thermosynechococcaceae cyanobacterium]